MKQTAVEWLVFQLQQTRDWQRVINEVNQSSSMVRDVVAEAKEMEKEQIINAFEHVDFNLDDGLHYYEQTYESNT